MVRDTSVEAGTRTVLRAVRWEAAGGGRGAVGVGPGAASGPSIGSDEPVQLAELACRLVATGREVPVRLQRIPSGWWIATVSGLDRFFVRGRSLRETRLRLRAGLDALVGEDLGAGAAFREHVVLPERVRWQLREAEALRERAERARREASEAVREAAVRLRREAGLSLRDAGDLLGLSAQRVLRIAPPRKGSYE